MSIVTRWWRQPQRVWFRRAIFQIHLWTGLAIGLYIVVLSLTGSVLVYRAELSRLVASPRATLDEGATPMTVDQLRAAAERAYPGWTASIVLEHDGQKKERLFDPYTGSDLGDYITQGERSLLWLVRLHDDLLLERPDGPWWNGLLSLVFTLIVLTGGVVWWPGVSRWKRGLTVKVAAGWRRFNWDLHSALGFWLFFFMVMWGISGWYLGMPEPLTNLVERLSDPEGPYGQRPGDIALEWLPRLHFGRWRDPIWGPWFKAVWAIVGVVPAIMFVTGLLMWWNRVVRTRRSATAVMVEST
jgi:uncharacterized iron-regulated membrane protein